ncbi:MAG: hypothetical protein M1817_005934 [Caeruleum heppii]|nr:MAG: hypothetical protein M1817_005934 [Caeruleum heppii]
MDLARYLLGYFPPSPSSFSLLSRLNQPYQDLSSDSNQRPSKMFLLRRAAVRALSPSITHSPVIRSRYINTRSLTALRPTLTSSLSPLQRRFASDDSSVQEAETQQEPAADGAVEASSSDPAPTNISDAPTPSSADADDHSTVASAISSAASGVSSSVSDTAESMAGSAQQAKDSVMDGAAAAAATAGLTSSTSPSSVSSSGSPSADGRTYFPPSPTVYIGNLFFNVNENDLKEQMSKFGTVDSCKIVFDRRGLSKGIAFVQYTDQASADRAIEQMHNQVYEGRQLAVQYAAGKTVGQRQARTPSQPSRTLFIGNMSFDMTDTDLNNLFSDVKDVVDVRVAIDRSSGQPKGFAHADFVDVSSAQEALKQLTGREILGRTLRLDFGQEATSRRKTLNPMGLSARESS